MNPWDKFFEEKIKIIFGEKKSVIDIGGGLRIDKDKGSRFDPQRSWIIPLAQKIEYKILDPVPDYHPDIIGNIHDLPLADNSQEAIICMAVLEHVENPMKAMEEIYRVLKPGGFCFLYMPFLFYYHAEPGYYSDYWRFTEDSIKLLCKNFFKIELCSVRGPIATWLHLNPIGKYRMVKFLSNWLDRVSGKTKSKQVSGYYVFLVK
jgi:SAM-dependent methyltransferase